MKSVQEAAAVLYRAHMLNYEVDDDSQELEVNGRHYSLDGGIMQTQDGVFSLLLYNNSGSIVPDDMVLDYKGDGITAHFAVAIDPDGKLTLNDKAIYALGSSNPEESILHDDQTKILVEDQLNLMIKDTQTYVHEMEFKQMMLKPTVHDQKPQIKDLSDQGDLNTNFPEQDNDGLSH